MLTLLFTNTLNIEKKNTFTACYYNYKSEHLCTQLLLAMKLVMYLKY